MTYLHIEQLYHMCCKVQKGNITSLQSLVKVFMVISHEQRTKATAKEFLRYYNVFYYCGSLAKCLIIAN